MRLFLPTVDLSTSRALVPSSVLTFASFLDQFLRLLLSSQQVGDATRLKHFDLERIDTDRSQGNNDNFSTQSQTIDNWWLCVFP